MRFHESLATVAEFSPRQFEDIRRNIDPQWILQALQAMGTATVRRRRLPAEQVVWLVIGMALMRNRSINDVAAKLDLALPGFSTTVVPSALADARARLGDDPMEWLFETCAEHWAHASASNHRWRGLGLYGVDGSSLRVPDSSENAEHFGYSNSCRGESGYPLVRLASLMALRSHLLAAVSFGPYRPGEYTYAANLWPSVPDDSLTIVDKNFFSAVVLISLVRGPQQLSVFNWRQLPKMSKFSWRGTVVNPRKRLLKKGTEK